VKLGVLTLAGFLRMNLHFDQTLAVVELSGANSVANSGLGRRVVSVLLDGSDWHFQRCLRD
jgi:hypothetical protein